jgi:hypothetical protein
MTLDEKYEELREKLFVDPNQEVEYPPVAISYGSYKTKEAEYHTPLGTYGNFSFVQAPPKSKKTFFISMIAGAYLADTTKNTGDILGHRNNKKLVHFDTEQGTFHAQKVFKRVIDLAKTNDNYQINLDDYDTLALRTLSAPMRTKFIDWYLEKYQDEIGLVIIDGIADLVLDVNDIKESSAIVQDIMRWTEEYNIHIMVVIHSNFNSDKPTGHLGSFLEKKTETQIQLTVREDSQDLVDVICKRSRSYPFENFSFEVDFLGLPNIIDKIDDILRIDTKF